MDAEFAESSKKLTAAWQNKCALKNQQSRVQTTLLQNQMLYRHNII